MVSIISLESIALMAGFYRIRALIPLIEFLYYNKDKINLDLYSIVIRVELLLELYVLVSLFFVIR